MFYALLSEADFGRLRAELRDPQQVVEPSGGSAFHVGWHPLYGRTTLVLDGERYALLVSRHVNCLPKLAPLSQCLAGCRPAWASAVALGAMLTSAG